MPTTTTAPPPLRVAVGEPWPGPLPAGAGAAFDADAGGLLLLIVADRPTDGEIRGASDDRVRLGLAPAGPRTLFILVTADGCLDWSSAPYAFGLVREQRRGLPGREPGEGRLLNVVLTDGSDGLHHCSYRASARSLALNVVRTPLTFRLGPPKNMLQRAAVRKSPGLVPMEQVSPGAHLSVRRKMSSTGMPPLIIAITMSNGKGPMFEAEQTKESPMSLTRIDVLSCPAHELVEYKKTGGKAISTVASRRPFRTLIEEVRMAVFLKLRL